jgi:hypothetical protein
MPGLERRAEELDQRARRALTERGDSESREMRAILEGQERRIRAQQARVEAEGNQLQLGLYPDEERQLAADRRHWARRLMAIADELHAEPERVRRSYEVKARRIEPVGLVYLWPLSS